MTNTYRAGSALLEKYTIKAPVDGVVLSVKAALGSYISPQGVYDTYTQGLNPVIVMGNPEDELVVRCYVDEILINRLPDVSKMQAQMFLRGTKIRIPLEYIRLQPYVSPKIQLSNQRTERVDVRVLPVLFRFKSPLTCSSIAGNWWMFISTRMVSFCQTGMQRQWNCQSKRSVLRMQRIFHCVGKAWCWDFARSCC
ncbi:HlyD family secretion protein [candidate division WWE3 bacterium]|uniref:HlyD family secretion protein n=1 Tax=candidate division WWE3 bacterium TaxID=2053526 RepID=A0A928TRU1_UNCKA|nr:HlyD family secretion protein [candidate division WWE3 bacterium]